MFFTFSGDIIMTYIVPGLPALALLLSRQLENIFFLKNDISNVNQGEKYYSQANLVKYSAIFTPIFILFVLSIVLLRPGSIKSENTLISPLFTKAQTIPVYYLNKIQFSSRFYSHGKAKLIMKKDLYLYSNKPFYLAVLKSQGDILELRKFTRREVAENKRYKFYKVN